MNLIQRILARWRKPPPTPLTYTLGVDLVEPLRRIAEREKSTPDDMARALLISGIQQYQRRDNHWDEWDSLSPREQEITALICKHYYTRQIALKLVLSEETIKTHVRALFLKFHVHDRNELRLLLKDWDFSDWFKEE